MVRVWSNDVKLAYLQSAELMLRRVFTRDVPPALEFKAGQSLELPKPLFGLADSGGVGTAR